MAVVINEFEVVPEPPPGASNTSPNTVAPPPPPRPLTLLELEQLLRREFERALRVWAH